MGIIPFLYYLRRKMIEQDRGVVDKILIIQRIYMVIHIPNNLNHINMITTIWNVKAYCLEVPQCRIPCDITNLNPIYNQYIALIMYH